MIILIIHCDVNDNTGQFSCGTDWYFVRDNKQYQQWVKMRNELLLLINYDLSLFCMACEMIILACIVMLLITMTVDSCQLCHWFFIFSRRQSVTNSWYLVVTMSEWDVRND